MVTLNQLSKYEMYVFTEQYAIYNMMYIQFFVVFTVMYFSALNRLLNLDCPYICIDVVFVVFDPISII